MVHLALPLRSGAQRLPVFLSSPPGNRSSTPGENATRGAQGGRVGAPRRLLLVEDNPADADLVREALRGLPFPIDVSTAQDGEQALAALKDAAARSVLPDLVLLDLNLPRMSGHEVLAALKTDPALSGLPVVVLTSSSAAEDSDASRALRVDGFVTKPLELDEYIRIVQAAARPWLQRSRA